jgi:amidohydrolase
MDLDALKAAVCSDIDRRAGALIEVAHAIHDHPELGFEEHFAHDLLTSVLADAKLDTERAALDVPTAFRARAGGQGPLVAVLCEYDALPDLGHACGHNVIAAAGLGAGLALAGVAAEAGGRLLVLGTPAEEGGGGKVVLAERGAFDGVDAAMMVHPADADLLWMDTIAIAQLEVEYHGESAHAAAAPWKGRNALDAAVLGYQNVAALRQHINPRERIHGIFTKAGEKPNIVPREAAAFWYVRSPTLASLEPLKERVVACLQAGADAAGCAMRVRWGAPATNYSDMRDNAPMVEAYVANSVRLGRAMGDPRLGNGVVGSTDMGNVSYLVPSIHPMIKVAPDGVPIHSAEFARHTRTEAADRAVLDGAKALAMTAVDLWAADGVLDAARREFAAQTV